MLLEKQQHGQRKVLLKSSERILSKKAKTRSVRKILFNLYNRDDFTQLKERLSILYWMVKR